MFEVRLIRGAWARPFGTLNETSIEAAKKLNRWALDKLYDPKIIAVGAFKVAPASSMMRPLWAAEIHQLVAGATQEDLERIFAAHRTPKQFQDGLLVRSVTNLGQAVSDVLRRDVRTWQHPGAGARSDERPPKAGRTEYYSWLLGLGLDECLVRYGCDRYFNRIQKRRNIRLKPPKPRPYPYWLQPYMFGNGGRWARGLQPTDMMYEPRRKVASRGRVPAGYYDDLD